MAPPSGTPDPVWARAGGAATPARARAAGPEREPGGSRISATRGRGEAARAWPRGTMGRGLPLGPTIEMRNLLRNA